MDAAKSEKNVTKAVLKANNLMNDVQANQLMEHINNVVKPNVKYLGIDTLQNEHLVDNALNACGGAFQLEADSEDTTDNEKTCDNVWGLMEQMAGNGLTDPWTGAPDQPVLPWRGRITTSLAPGQAGSPDGSAAATAASCGR